MVGDSNSTLPSACVGEDSRSLPALGQWKKEQIKYKSRGKKVKQNIDMNMEQTADWSP